MKRLLLTIHWDLVRQYRNGFWAASGFFALISAAVLQGLRGQPWIRQELAIPALLMLNLIITTYFYVAALVLLEKDEGTLAGLVVTPLQPTEYLLGKIVSLTLLGMVETLLVVILVWGTGFRPLPILTGMIMLGALYTSIGFVAVARYDAINAYLLPAGVGVGLLILPLVDHLHLWRSPIFWLHPAQPALVLLRTAFVHTPTWEIMYGLLGGAFWLGMSLLWARHIFHRFVVRTAGD